MAWVVSVNSPACRLSACLGIATTVEGVETGEQLAFSVAEGCDTIQGYHISRPLTGAAFDQVLDLTQACRPRAERSSWRSSEAVKS